MLISSTLFFVFSSLCLLSSILVITAKNPIFSVLFLISSFANVACVLFLFNFEFLPVSFIVIYVGAIAVLFLFVLMMLNIKLAELNENSSNYLPLAIAFCILFVFELLCLFRFEFNLFNVFDKNSVIFLSDYLNVFMSKTYFLNLLSLTSNVKTISFALFTDYLYCFLLSGFVLLLAMVAAIVLTIQKKFVSKSQNIYSQILRDYNNALVHYS
jgi:NADH-quinone oxidoreductase subunit J